MDSFGLAIGIIAGIIAIVTAVIKFISWIKNRSKASGKVLKVFERDKNIFGIYKDGTERQLTFQEADLNSILVRKKSKVVFLRSEKISSKTEYTRYKLMTLDVSTTEERILLDQKPYRDGNDWTFEILQPTSLTISPDNSKVIFIIEKYVTGSELVQVDLNTGKFDDLFSAEKFDIIRSGKYRNKFLVGVSEIRNEGRQTYYKVCDSRGDVLHEFVDYDEYMVFRSKALVSK